MFFFRSFFTAHAPIVSHASYGVAHSPLAGYGVAHAPLAGYGVAHAPLGSYGSYGHGLGLGPYGYGGLGGYGGYGLGGHSSLLSHGYYGSTILH